MKESGSEEEDMERGKSERGRERWGHRESPRRQWAESKGVKETVVE